MVPPKDRLASLHAYLSIDDRDEFIGIDEVENPHKEFFAEIQDIKDTTDKIEDTVTEVKKIQSGILSSPRIDMIKQNQLDGLMEHIKTVANLCR